MRLTDEDLDKFIKLYHNRTGITLTREEAIGPATRLINYVRAVVRGNTKQYTKTKARRKANHD